jgi:phosphohistidine phosphatase
MEIYLLRHGIAEDARPGMGDSERALTRDGIERLRRVLTRAHKAGVAPSLILSSPYRRAVETAQIAAEILEYRGEIVRTTTLVPNASPATTWDEVRVLGGDQVVLLASHEPLMSSLVGYLLGTPSLEVDFKKGALARIVCGSTGSAPRGVLKWLITASLA